MGRRLGATVCWVGVLVIIVSLAATAGGAAQAPVTLKVSSEVGIHTEAWKTDLPALEKATGIKVDLTQFPFQKYREMLMLDYTGGSPSYDVSYVSYGWYRSLVNGGHLEPFDSFDLKALNLDDIPNMSLYPEKGKVFFVPYMNEIAGILYRKDLFEDPKEQAAFRAKYGYALAPPKTFAQYRDVAEFFHRPPNLYGVSLMGKRSVFLTVHFANRLWGNGGAILDEKMRPAFQSEAGVEALKDLKEMFKYSNPASPTHLFAEAVEEFQQGKSAMLEIWSTVLLYVNDPKTSKVVGKVGFAPIPKTQATLTKKVPYLYIAWGFIINKASTKKKEAFEFVKFITSRDSEIRTAPHGNIPARFSVLDAPQVNQMLPWMRAVKQTMEANVLTPIYPWIPEGASISSDILSIAITQYLSGEKDAKAALDDAARETQKLLEKGGYYK
jgi:multiple sugar transport system substrate-binding protein